MVEQNLKHHSNSINNEYNKYIRYKNKCYAQIEIDYLNEEDESESDFVDEICQYCGIHMNDANEIFVDLERDVYICRECGDRHRVKIVRCKGLE